jgi:hypothetical protein
MKKTLLWRAMFLAASLSSVMSVGASPFEGEESSCRSSSSHTGAGEKRKATVLGEDTKTPKKTRGDDLSVQEESLQAPLAIAGDVIQDASLGDLVVVPKEVLGMIFSHLENPLVMRKVSTATKAIVDTQVPFPVSIENIARYLKGPEINPHFSMDRPVALKGESLDLRKAKARFPQGTIFKGGNLVLYGVDEFYALPEGATARLFVDTAEQAKTILTKVQGKGVKVEVLALSCELNWEKYLQTETVRRLNPDQLQALHNNKKRLISLVAFNNGVRYLDWFVQAGIVERRYGPGDVPVDVNKIFSPFDRLGTDIEKYNIFRSMSPNIFKQCLRQGFVFDTVLESLASLPDYKTRLYVVSRLNDLVLDDVYFYRGTPNHFKQLVTFLAANMTSERPAPLRTIDISRLYKICGIVPSLMMGESFSKIDPKDASIILQFLTRSHINAYWTDVADGKKRFEQNSFEQMLFSLKGFDYSALDHIFALGYDQNPLNQSWMSESLFGVLQELFHSTSLQQPHNGEDKVKRRQTLIWGAQALKGLQHLEKHGRSEKTSALFVKEFSHAFKEENPVNRARPQIHVDAFFNAANEIENLPSLLRGPVMNMITKPLVDLTYDAEKKAPDGKLCVDLAKALIKALINDRQAYITDHLAVHELTNPFVKFFSEEPEMLTDAVAAVARIADPKIREGAIKEVPQAFASNPTGRKKALLFLKKPSKINKALQSENHPDCRPSRLEA